MLLAVAICGVLGSGLLNSVLALAAIFVPPMVRISESVTAQVCVMPFVEAARASGASGLQVIRYHVMSDALGTILVYATSLFSISIILASGLSFLGLGVDPSKSGVGPHAEQPATGHLCAAARRRLPGAMIFLTSMCFNLLSDGLRAQWM